MLLVELSFFILFASFLVSILCFFFDGSLSTLPTIVIAIELSLLKEIAKRLRYFSLAPLIAIVAIVGRAITKWGAIEKSKILR